MSLDPYIHTAGILAILWLLKEIRQWIKIRSSRLYRWGYINLHLDWEFYTPLVLVIFYTVWLFQP